MTRVAFSHRELYPVREPDVNLEGWSDADVVDVPPELLQRWALVKREWQAVQDAFKQIEAAGAA